MKAFIFKPSDKWSYCGGGLVILAKTFEEAKALFEKDNIKEFLFKTEEDVNEEDCCDMWVLVATLNCPDEKESKIILYDYNWG